MEKNIPDGWTIRKLQDSLIVFNRLVHKQYALDPPPDSYGWDDTSGIYVRFYSPQTKKEIADNDSMVAIINRKIKKLNYEHSNPPDSVFRGKKFFYDWVRKLRQLERERSLFAYIQVKKWSLQINDYAFNRMLIDFDEAVIKEVEEVKTTLLDYLKK